jgi:hypothetical protein
MAHVPADGGQQQQRKDISGGLFLAHDKKGGVEMAETTVPAVYLH